MNENLPIRGYGLLAAVASHKQYISYGEVYDKIGARLGWRARWNGHSWCAPVKTICCATAEINKAHDEPLLASLVRHADGSIGVGYKTAVKIRYGIDLPNNQIQAHANAEAAQCWAYFGLS
jgi:hypothetical protein